MKTSMRIIVTLLLCALLLIYVADMHRVLETLSHCDPTWAVVALLALLLDRMALGGVQPADALAVSLAARALQIIVWLPWWVMLAARTGIRPPMESAAPAVRTSDIGPQSVRTES